MTNIRRSAKMLSPEESRKFKALAQKIDREEAPAIKARGRAVLAQHEHLRSLLQALVAERKRHGLSLADMANRTGIAKPNLSRLENNQHATPSIDTLERYAQAVGKTLSIELRDAA